MARLVLDDRLHVTPYGDDEVFVRRGSRSPFSKVIRDDGRRGVLRTAVEQLTSPLDRETLLADIAARTGQDASDVEAVLELLISHDVVREDASDVSLPTVTVAGDGRVAATVADLLAADGHEPSTISLETGTSADEELLLDALESLTDSDVMVIAFDRLRPAITHAANEAASAAGTRTLHVNVDGSEVVVGPFVVPGETACYTCFEIGDEATRLHRHDYIAYKDRLDRDSGTRQAPPAVASLAASWAALAMQAAARTDRSFAHGRVVRIDTERSEVVSHRVLQLPRCPVCSRARHDLRHTFL